MTNEYGDREAEEDWHQRHSNLRIGCKCGVTMQV